MDKVLDELFVELEAGMLGDFVVDVLDVLVKVLLQLGSFGFVVSKKVRVHLDPIVPVHLADSHGDEIRAMAEGTVELWGPGHRVKIQIGLRHRRYKGLPGAVSRCRCWRDFWGFFAEGLQYDEECSKNEGCAC